MEKTEMQEKKGFAFYINKIASPIGVVISMSVAIIALVTVLITNQVQDCTNSKNGFATVVHHVDTNYFGYAVFLSQEGGNSPDGGGFITNDNGDVNISVKPGKYDLHQYFVRSDQYRIMYDFIAASNFRLPGEEIYDKKQKNNIHLCAGDEYHILAWNQPDN